MRTLPCACCLFLCFAVGVAAGAPNAATDWPQWRGPGRDGVALAIDPGPWPDALQRAWSVDVGEGQSGPLIVGDRVLQFSRDSGREVMQALSLTDGRQLWSNGYETSFNVLSFAANFGEGPKSTPATDGSRVFSLGIAGVLTAFSIEDGAVLWQHRFADRYDPPAPTFGTSMSPLLVDDLVIAHVGDDASGSLAAFEAATGSTRWSLDGDGPGYSSPIVLDLGGVRQLVTLTTENIVGVDVADGALLWSLPLEGGWSSRMLTPVHAGGYLIFSGQDLGVFAVSIERDGDGWTTQEIWRNRDVSMSMSTPVLAGGRLYGMSHMNSGQYFALDPATGEIVWVSDPRVGESAVVLALGDDLLFMSDSAQLSVLPKGTDDFAPTASYRLSDTPTWAHPAVSNDSILVKDETRLTLWRIDDGS